MNTIAGITPYELTLWLVIFGAIIVAWNWRTH